MFGNAPKALWSRYFTPDDQNRISLACRALLVQENSGRRILFETGIGAFFNPELRERYGVQGSEHVLLNNLRALGVDDSQIDVVVLSHLHFDHAGGLLKPWQAAKELELCFPNARYVVSEAAWQRANHPHLRDRASFISTLPDLLENSSRLEVFSGYTSETLGPSYRFHISEGHTPGLALAQMQSSLGPLVFASDLIPARPWMHLPITMGYDRFPEKLIEEKENLLDELLSEQGLVFFTHDPEVALARVSRDSKGKFQAGESWSELALA